MAATSRSDLKLVAALGDEEHRLDTEAAGAARLLSP